MDSPSSRILLHICTTILLFASAVLLTPEIACSSLQQDMEDKNRQLAEQKREIQELTDQERTLHKDLATLEKSVQDTAAALQDQEKTLDALQKDQATTARELDSLLAERTRTTKRLSDLLGTLWPVFLRTREQGFSTTQDWAESNRREEWIAALYRSAQAMREDIERQSQAVADRQATLDQSTARTAAKRDAIKASRAELDKKLNLYTKQLQDIRVKKALGEKEIQDLIGSIASIRHQITLQESKQFTKNQGKLEWPVKGKTVVNFDPDATPPSTGIGLSVPSGTPVHAMSWGKVVHNDQLRGFGQVVIIFHGEDYYSLYAFLSGTSVTVGSEVERGQQIGVSGFYPAAKGNGLYFELRFHQKAINPLKWLQSG